MCLLLRTHHHVLYIVANSSHLPTDRYFQYQCVGEAAVLVFPSWRLRNIGFQGYRASVVQSSVDGVTGRAQWDFSHVGVECLAPILWGSGVYWLAPDVARAKHRKDSCRCAQQIVGKAKRYIRSTYLSLDKVKCRCRRYQLCCERYCCVLHGDKLCSCSIFRGNTYIHQISNENGPA